MASKILKTSTKLTGIPVAQNPMRTLGVLYCKILRVMEHIPESAAYRRHTEAIIKERQKALLSSKCPEEAEQKICCGQIEEVIMQAENELNLARNMMVWKPWEPLMDEPPENQWTWPPAIPIEPR